MTAFSFVLIRTVVIMFGILSFAMLGRAILSWFVRDEDSFILGLLYLITEPVILPVRGLCSIMGWFENIPIDFPFLITAFIISIANGFLTSLL